MSEKKSVQTFRLKRRKVYGVWIGILVTFVLSAILFGAAQYTTLGTGRFLFATLNLVCVGLFLFLIIVAIRLYRENYIGFFLSADGFNDISTGHEYGVVFWRDVLDVKVMDDIQNLKYKYVVVMVKEPQMYIDRERSQYKKRSLLLKLHYYGSPLCFSNRGLDCTFDELLKAINMYRGEYKKRT